MPEGDAVRRTARRLDEALAGHRISRCDLRVPRFATVDLTGWEVLGTQAVGKHLLTRFTGPGPAVSLHTHLRMEGRWATGGAGPEPCAGPWHQIRAWLVTDRTQAVGLRLGLVEVLATGDEARAVGHLGPDILDPAVPVDVLAARLTGRPDRQLGAALLDQRVICGLGTMWVSEAAWLAGASPWSRVAEVSDPAGWLAQIRTRMLASATGPRLRAERQFAVFERSGLPCRRCGGRIRAGRVGTPPQDRATYWCPACQPGPTR